MGRDEDEELRALEAAAEHKAAALHRLGWEEGAGATVWARAVSDELFRHEEARERFGQGPQDLESWERLHSTALLLVVAIDQVLTFERRVRSLTGDADLASARREFDAVGLRAEALRDLVAHLDEYATGAGRRQTGKAKPAIAEPYLSTFIWWGDNQGTILELGDESLNLRTAANAAVELAAAVERARVKHLNRAAQKADAISRRRWGIAE